MKTLHLSLEKKWFDMILSGQKKEEYRKVKPYWRKRLLGERQDVIKFVNGYGNNRPWMLVEYIALYRSLGIIEWGAPKNKVVFILRLGKILDKGNIKP